MKCKECNCCHEVILNRWSSDNQCWTKETVHQCWGVKEPFVIANINQECSEYEHKRNENQKEVGIKSAITHFKYGISHDIFKEPVTSYAKMAVDALEKQIPQKPDLEGDGYWNGELVYDTGICPTCGQDYEIEYHTPKFCKNCGQALDWSNIK